MTDQTADQTFDRTTGQTADRTAEATGGPSPAPAPPTSGPGSCQPEPEPTGPSYEDLPRGLLFSLAAVPVGMVVSVGMYRAGFVLASFSSFVLAGLAVFLYRRGAGAISTRGVLVICAVTLVGVVLSFVAMMSSDLMEYSSAHRAEMGVTESTFVTTALTDAEFLGAYAGQMGRFALFAALGAFGVLRRVGLSD